MSAIQIERCGSRIRDSATRARFVALLTSADALTYQAAEMRREAWSAYRAALLEQPTSRLDLMPDRVASFMARQLLRPPMATAADDARAILAASDARDLDELPSTMPLPVLTYEEWQARLKHESGHAELARDRGAREIEVLIRSDGTGWCSYSPLENPVDAILAHLVGVAAEARAYPPSLGRYAGGCFDFTSARLLLDQYNAAGRWPPMTCESAAERAVEFVEAHAKQIRALALVLGSAGSLTDFEVRLFAAAGCAQ